MKVAVLGGYAPSLLNFRGPMMRAMQQAGHEVVGLAPDSNPEVTARLADLGIAYQSVPIARTGMNPIRDLASIRALTRTFQDMKPDLLLSYTVKPVIYGSLAAVRAGVPRRYAMITGLGSGLQGEGFKDLLLARLIRAMYRKGIAANQGVIFQNPDDQAYFERHRLMPRDCATTLINGSGVDLEHFAQVPQPEVPLTFLMVARLVRDKGLLEYVEAARLLKSQGVRARCLLLGPFDTNPTAISRGALGAWEEEGILEYLGEAKDVRPFLAQAHVLVLPSYGEGTPRSVLEAMAMGRAVVTTLAPGCKETVLPEKTGFLVPVKDSAALAEAMGRFAADPELAPRMGKAGRAYAEEKYDVDKVNTVILRALSLSV